MAYVWIQSRVTDCVQYFLCKRDVWAESEGNIESFQKLNQLIPTHGLRMHLELVILESFPLSNETKIILKSTWTTIS